MFRLEGIGQAARQRNLPSRTGKPFQACPLVSAPFYNGRYIIAVVKVDTARQAFYNDRYRNGIGMARHREFNIDQALDAALAVFWAKGYEGASYDDLTRATGVGRPSLYAAFGNKQALFLQTLERYEARYMAFMQDVLREPTARRVVDRLLMESAAAQTAHADSPGCLGINGALACSEDAEPVRLELVRRRALSQGALRDRFEQARAVGDLPGSADCAALAAFVMAVSQGMAVQAKAGATRAELEGIAACVDVMWPSPAPAQPN